MAMMGRGLRPFSKNDDGDKTVGMKFTENNGITRLSFQSQADHLQTGHRHAFCCCDLDLHLMTLIYEPDLDIQTRYLDTKNEVSRSRFSKVNSPNRQKH